MALDDFIDSAMNAAEAKMVDSAPVVDKEVEAAEVQLVDRQQESEGTIKGGERTRAPDGKFAKAPKPASNSAPEKEAENQPQQQILTDQNANATQDGASVEHTAPTELPAFWPDELKKAAAEAPKAVVEAFVKHDAQREEWARRTANEGARGKAFEQRMYEGYEPQAIQAHRAKLQLQGLRDEVDELHRYRAWDTVFQSDAYTGIADLMQKNGFTPYDFIQGASQEPQYQTDPRIEQELQDLRTVKQQFEEFQTRFKTQEEEGFRNSIESFKAGTDSSGQPRKQFAELYAPQITQTHEQIQQMYPHLSFDECLNAAYEHTLSEVRKLHGATAPKPAPKTETIIANAKKAQGAASSVVGTPRTETVTSKPRAKSFDEAFARAEEIVYGNSAR